MGGFACLATTQDEYEQIIETIEKGFVSADGVKHRPNERVAFALRLEKATGCRISDIVKLTPNSFVRDGMNYRINITEKKTGKKRRFTVAKPVYDAIQDYCKRHDIQPEQMIIGTTTRQIQKHLQYATKYLGMECISTHSMRKMAGQQILELTNNDITAVQEFYQHTSPTTTAKYLTQASATLQRALNKMTF